jgi:two-component system, NtrC family, sensor kinase
MTSLRTAVVAFAILPSLLVTAVIGLAGLRGLEERVAARMQEDLELVARTLRLPLSNALAQDRPGVIQSTIESTVGIGRVYGVYVYDADGRMIAGSGRWRAAVPTDQAAELAGQPELKEGVADLGDEQLHSVFQPLTGVGGQISGLLQVTRRGSDVQDYVTRMRWMTLLAIGAVALLFTAVVVLGHHFAVGRHLSRLDEDMARIRKGDFSHRMEARGVAEFRGLARGINRMLDGIAASHREIDRRRDTEQALRERLSQSEKMAAIGRLAAGVAHELGSPLSTVFGRAQQMLRRAAPGTAEHEALRDVHDSAVRMEHTIRQLMDFGRANPLNRTRVALAGLLGRLADDAREKVRDTVRIEVQVPEALPPVSADALRLEQALRNLIDNAVQAAHSRVRVEAVPDAEGLQISVGDDGPGVPAQERRRVFDPFYTTKAVGQGTGLGLSVASAVAEDHGGRLILEDDPLGGARFILTVPWEAPDGRT